MSIQDTRWPWLPYYIHVNPRHQDCVSHTISMSIQDTRWLCLPYYIHVNPRHQMTVTVNWPPILYPCQSKSPGDRDSHTVSMSIQVTRWPWLLEYTHVDPRHQMAMAYRINCVDPRHQMTVTPRIDQFHPWNSTITPTLHRKHQIPFTPRINYVDRRYQMPVTFRKTYGEPRHQITVTPIQYPCRCKRSMTISISIREARWSWLCFPLPLTFRLCVRGISWVFCSIIAFCRSMSPWDPARFVRLTRAGRGAWSVSWRCLRWCSRACTSSTHGGSHGSDEAPLPRGRFGTLKNERQRYTI